MAALAGRGQPGKTVHVCGLGVFCDWDEVADAAGRLGGAKNLFWYCGRGYLDADRERLEAFSTCCFDRSGTNAAAVANHLGMDSGEPLDTLLDLAAEDDNVRKRAGKPTVAARDRWHTYLLAAMEQGFKLEDDKPFARAIRALATLEMPAEADDLIQAWQQFADRHRLLGRSAAMKTVHRRIRRFGPLPHPVLVTGESGTGKENATHLLHECSGPRATGPMVSVNCALFGEGSELVNAALFGHRRGAFTGAEHDRPGAFVEADGGTLFLDELGEMPLTVQAKLLRVLEDGRITPVGSDTVEATVNVRVLAATNRNLPAMIRAGTFREDLYHRLSVLTIHLPPLRERRSDIPQLMEVVKRRLAAEGVKLRLTTGEQEALQAYPWPGNVRQLNKVLLRKAYLGVGLAEVLAEESALGLDPAGAATTHGLLPASEADVLPVKTMQARYAAHCYNLMGQNKERCARALGIAENTLRRYLAMAEEE